MKNMEKEIEKQKKEENSVFGWLWRKKVFFVKWHFLEK